MDKTEDQTTRIPGLTDVSNATIYVLLALLTLLAYFQILGADFIEAYDDELYVTLNNQVKKGLSSETFRWAFTSYTAGNWTPLTMLSHMLDVTLYGLKPAGHHATSLIFHIINTLLMFRLFVMTTKEKGKSFLIAALFSLHPLHVESVAWVAERKDVLSVMFGLLAIISYVRFAASGSLLHYAAMFLCYCLSLMSKPMLVTLPFVLLLLDFWPLDRGKGQGARGCREYEVTTDSGTAEASRNLFRAAGPLSLFLEKLPLFIPAFAISWTAVIAQRAQGALVSGEGNPLSKSIPIAIDAYVTYIRKTFWPSDLTVFYPYEPVPWGRAALPLAIITGITLAAWLLRKKGPFLLAGWLFFLGTLVPVIGIVRVGMQSYADRYTYFPLTGIFVMLVWGTAAALKQAAARKALAGAALAACIVLTMLQVGKWKNGEKLYTHTMNVTQNNWLAHNNLGVMLARREKLREALAQQLMAITIAPGFPDGHHNVGANYARLNMHEEAVNHFRTAIKLRPLYGDSYIGISRSLRALNRPQEALEAIEGGLKQLPDNPLLMNNKALILQKMGRVDESISIYRRMIELNPGYPPTYSMLGFLLAQTGRKSEALQVVDILSSIDRAEATSLMRSITPMLNMQ